MTSQRFIDRQSYGFPGFHCRWQREIVTNFNLSQIMNPYERPNETFNSKHQIYLSLLILIHSQYIHLNFYLQIVHHIFHILIAQRVPMYVGLASANGFHIRILIALENAIFYQNHFHFVNSGFYFG